MIRLPPVERRRSARRRVRARAPGLLLLAAACAPPAPSAAPAPGAVAEAPAPVPERWAGVIGLYAAGSDTLSVLERAGELRARLDGRETPLRELAPDTFGLADGGRVVFARDARGRTERAELAGRELAAVAVGPEGGRSFRIEPVRPVEALRREALAATPPPERDDFRDPELVELTALDPALRLDIRYATTNNFMGARFYDQPRAFLQRPAAEALVRAHRRLRRQGYGLLIHDAYRPWYVTRMFWDATPEHQKAFVADPARGSRHNRGSAVDLSLFDLRTGEPVEMVSGYDEFTPRAYPDYPGGTSRQRWHRELLREAMEAEGFTVYDAEWWHFDHQDWRRYPILNLRFEEIAPNP